MKKTNAFETVIHSILLGIIMIIIIVNAYRNFFCLISLSTLFHVPDLLTYIRKCEC